MRTQLESFYLVEQLTNDLTFTLHNFLNSTGVKKQTGGWMKDYFLPQMVTWLQVLARGGKNTVCRTKMDCKKILTEP
jgi:hypothetical protein